MQEESWDTPNHNKNWMFNDKLTLLKLWESGNSVATCARKLGRTKLSIVCKLVSLQPPKSEHLSSSDESTWYNQYSLVSAWSDTGCTMAADSVTIYANADTAITQMTSSNKPIKKEQPTMNKFTTIKNFNDSAAQVTASLTLDDFINEIADKEAAIKALDRLEHKPKAVVSKIAKLTEEIAALVTQCDELVK